MAVETETQLEAWLAENVPAEPNLQIKTGIQITQNGEFSITPDAGYDGLESVSGVVAVPEQDSYIKYYSQPEYVNQLQYILRYVFPPEGYKYRSSLTLRGVEFLTKELTSAPTAYVFVSTEQITVGSITGYAVITFSASSGTQYNYTSAYIGGVNIKTDIQSDSSVIKFEWWKNEVYEEL